MKSIAEVTSGIREGQTIVGRPTREVPIQKGLNSTTGTATIIRRESLKGMMNFLNVH